MALGRSWHFRESHSGLAQLPLEFDLGVEKEETTGANRFPFLAARGSPCGLPTAVLCCFRAENITPFAAEREMVMNDQRPHSKHWDLR
jgi:hypothetical protein